jgi:hypothetical protein
MVPTTTSVASSRMRRVGRAERWIAPPCIGALALLEIACASRQTRVVARYSVAGTYVSDAHRAEALPVDVSLVDCGSGPWLQIGPTCRLSGSWMAGTQLQIDDDNRPFHEGAVALAAGQTCRLPTRDGPAVLQISNGVMKLEDQRVIEVSLGAEVASGTGARSGPPAHATFAFTGVPSGPLVDAFCDDDKSH